MRDMKIVNNLGWHRIETQQEEVVGDFLNSGSAIAVLDFLHNFATPHHPGFQRYMIEALKTVGYEVTRKPQRGEVR